MNFSLEKVVEKLQLLVNRMRTHENTVDEMIREAITLQAQLTNKKVCQEESLSITDFSKRVSTHPRGQLILCLAAENKELEQLRLENYTLFESIHEHQAALDIIMSKYRGQMSKLMRTNQVEELIRGSCNSLTSPNNRLEDASEAIRSTETTTAPSIPLSTGLDSAKSPASGMVTAQLVNGSASAAIRNAVANSGKINSRSGNEQLATLAAIAMDISDQGDAYAIELEEEVHRLRSENAGLREMLAISSAYSNDVGSTRSEDGAPGTSPSGGSSTQGAGPLPGPPNGLPNSNSDNWPFENSTDRSAGVSHFLSALKAHSNESFRFPTGLLPSSEEEADEDEDAMTVGENNELEVDIGRDTHMPNFANSE